MSTALATNAFISVQPRPVLEMPRDCVSSSNPAILVEHAGGARLAEIESDWRSLVARALESNVFMDPAILHLLAARSVTLLAWQTSTAGHALIGLWAFSIGRRGLFPALVSPPFQHAYLGTPVVDSTVAEAALGAMLDFIAHDPRLPKLIAVDPIRSDDATMQALARVLAVRGSDCCTLTEGRRPILASHLDAKGYFEQSLSSSSRKKLRQHRRRLEAGGALQSRICTTPDAVNTAFEDFLALEAAGWKGRGGTALLSDPADAAFARSMIAALAQHGDAAIHALYQNDKAVASQVVLRAGKVAFTWKTAYDEALGDFSPGMLLLEDYTGAFLSDRTIAMVDSCALDDTGFMSAWSERETLAHVLFDARPGRSPVLQLAAGLQKMLLRARAVAKALYLRGRRAWTR